MPNPIRDLTGMTKGRLTALRCVGRTKHGQAVWLFRCICDGKEIEVTSRGFVSGKTQSCGCLRKETTSIRMKGRVGKDHPTFKHGQQSSPTYVSWAGLSQRCRNPNCAEWKHYGAMGIRVCDRWLGEHGFENFLADLGERPKGTTLGRYGDVGNYEPGNCEWQTPKQQGAEQKIKRARIARQGEEQALDEIFGAPHAAPAA